MDKDIKEMVKKWNRGVPIIAAINKIMGDIADQVPAYLAKDKDPEISEEEKEFIDLFKEES